MPNLLGHKNVGIKYQLQPEETIIIKTGKLLIQKLWQSI